MSTPTAVFPGAIVTNAQLKVANNLIQTTLASAAGTTDTVLYVNSTAGFVPNSLVSIDSEIIAITAAATSPTAQLLVAPGGRGFDGTAPASHAAGALASMFIDAWHHNVLAAEVQAIEATLGTNMRNLTPIVPASTYNFPCQQPNLALVTGSNTIALSPMPLGLAVGNNLYISGGTGAAEAVPITGVTASSVTVTCANAHPVGYSVCSATCGIQETIATFPAAGGICLVNTNCTLYANVTDLGKTQVMVTRLAGSIITDNNFTIFGAAPSPSARQKHFQNGPNFASINTLWNGTQFDIGGFPDTLQFGFTTSADVQSLVGSINVQSGAVGHGTFSAGVSGYARTTIQDQDAVAVYGGGHCGGPNTQAWGANFTVMSDSGNMAGSVLTGVEIDVNHGASGANAASIAQALTIYANMPTAVTGHAYAVVIGSTNTVPFNVGIQFNDGACNTIAMSVGAVQAATNNVQSQELQFVSKSSTGVAQVGRIYLDANNQLFVRGGAATGFINLDPNPSGSGAGGAMAFSVGAAYNNSAMPLVMAPRTLAGYAGPTLAGMMMYITDGSSATPGAVVTGGGTNHVLIFYNGTSWIVG